MHASTHLRLYGRIALVDRKSLVNKSLFSFVQRLNMFNVQQDLLAHSCALFLFLTYLCIRSIRPQRLLLRFAFSKALGVRSNISVIRLAIQIDLTRLSQSLVHGLVV